MTFSLNLNPDLQEELFEKCRLSCSSGLADNLDKTRLDEIVSGKERRILDFILKDNYYTRLLNWLKGVKASEKTSTPNIAKDLLNDMDLLKVSDSEKENLRNLIRLGSEVLITNDSSLISEEQIVLLEDRVNKQIREQLLKEFE